MHLFRLVGVSRFILAFILIPSQMIRVHLSPMEKGSTMSNRKSPLLEAGVKDFCLTASERRIIALTVAGYSRRESAEKVGISVPALKLHLSRIYEKLRVSNQFELILLALYHRLVNPAADTSRPNSSRFLVVRGEVTT